MRLDVLGGVGLERIDAVFAAEPVYLVTIDSRSDLGVYRVAAKWAGGVERGGAGGYVHIYFAHI